MLLGCNFYNFTRQGEAKEKQENNGQPPKMGF